MCGGFHVFKRPGFGADSLIEEEFRFSDIALLKRRSCLFFEAIDLFIARLAMT
jgi:hypothetical protein